MIFLVLSILSSALFILSFKLFDKYKLQNIPVIICNYITAALLGISLSQNNEVLYQQDKSWLVLAMILGALFILSLNFVAKTTQRISVTVAGVANKMSLIMPVTISLLFYENGVSPLKIIGLLGIIALALTSVSSSDTSKEKTLKSNWYLPMLTFITAGTIDALMNYVQRSIIRAESFTLFLSVVFGVAGILGAAFSLSNKEVRKGMNTKNCIAGVILVCINFATMYFMLNGLNASNFTPSTYFSVNNIGVLLVSTLVAILIFKETLNSKNKLGFICAIVAIIIIGYSK